MRILIIEDDEKIADFVANGLLEADYVIDQAANGRDGLRLASSGRYDLAIIDLMLPELDGLSIIERIRALKINLSILILSAKRSLDDRLDGLRTGGDDYLTKPFAFAELLARVQSLLRRASKLPESSNIEVFNLKLDLLARTVFREGKKISLQPKEFALLEYLMRNAGRVVSKTMIMDRVWGYNFDPQTNVVEARVCRLRDKVDKGFCVQLIHTVRGLGYVLNYENDNTPCA